MKKLFALAVLGSLPALLACQTPAPAEAPLADPMTRGAHLVTVLVATIATPPW